MRSYADSPRELMTRMGHASSRAALIYQHATADRDRAIADALRKLAVRGARAEHEGDDADPSGSAPAGR